MKKLFALLLVGLFVSGCAQHDGLHVSHTEYLDDHTHHDHHEVTSEEWFLVEMIPHHQEAIDMSLALRAITQDPVLKELTDAIIIEQEKEIAQMRAWLDAWYPTSSYVSSYMPMMRDTSGISAISTIEKIWLEDMIVHHMGAVMMAEDVLKIDPRPEVAAFARAIIAVQTDEIMLMQSLLQR
jgi:uncharacterized protein (DUF305 family)